MISESVTYGNFGRAYSSKITLAFKWTVTSSAGREIFSANYRRHRSAQQDQDTAQLRILTRTGNLSRFRTVFPSYPLLSLPDPKTSTIFCRVALFIL
ncbi:hypothetical protein RvY_07583 [Ramazzottius varieornatus]|uniref:Uncharacterized protein n=1 Tax=Ramazzottius varieornatus TaxID=947166 RepID=A0A1D1V7R0_RAMVA|nr:hypothetical protein RvY_07583 [Ramazzottius varieornatus]